MAQATDFGSGFVAFALVLLPVVFFLGWATVARLGQVNIEDARWVQGMNRIRHAYLELAPELEPYFVASSYDDEAGIRLSAMARREPYPRLQPFVSVPGVVAVINCVVAGAIFGIIGLGLDPRYGRLDCARLRRLRPRVRLLRCVGESLDRPVGPRARRPLPDAG